MSLRSSALPASRGASQPQEVAERVEVRAGLRSTENPPRASHKPPGWQRRWSAFCSLILTQAYGLLWREGLQRLARWRLGRCRAAARPRGWSRSWRLRVTGRAALFSHALVNLRVLQGD